MFYAGDSDTAAFGDRAKHLLGITSEERDISYDIICGSYYVISVRFDIISGRFDIISRFDIIRGRFDY